MGVRCGEGRRARGKGEVKINMKQRSTPAWYFPVQREREVMEEWRGE